MRDIAAFLKKNLHYLYDLVGGILFAAVMVGVVVHNFKLDSITPVLTLGFAVAFVLLQRLIDRLPTKGPAYWGIVAGVFLVMLIWHIAAAYLLELDINVGDARATMTSAMYLVAGDEMPIDTNKSFDSSYFAQYQNQFGYLFLLTAISKLGMLLTGHVSFTHFAVFNLMMIEISVLMVVICAEQIGRKTGVASCGLRVMAILAPAPFLWLMVPYAYTDSLSLPFIMGAILGGLYGINHIHPRRGVLLFQEKDYGDVIRFFAVGLLIAVGYKVKGNLIILLVALDMVIFVKAPIKKWIELSAALATAFAVVSLAFSFIISSSGLMTKEQSNRYKFPVTHWIMMGMDSFGYSSDDVAYTKSFTSYEAKKEAVARRIKEKYERMGPSRILKHYYDKATADSWDSGLFSMQTTLGAPSGSITPKRPSTIHEYVLSSGSKHKQFRVLANAYWNVLELFALCGYFSLHRKKKETGLVLIRLIITGTVIFFMIWEANWRYIFSSTILISILAAFQMESFGSIGSLHEVKDNFKKLKPRLFSAVNESMVDIVGEQLEKKHYAQAEKLVSLYGRLGEAITYGSKQQRAVSAEASAMRQALDKRKAQQRVVDNARFYLDLWKNPDDIAQAQLANIIESGLQLRGKLMALEDAQTEGPVVELIREMDMRIKYMQSRLPEGETKNTMG